MKRLVWIPQGMNMKLQEKFGVSRATVSSALHYRTNSPLAKAIREWAKENGGQLLKVPDDIED